MLKSRFDPLRPYRAVLYLRMSSDSQNPRSPDQQEAEIRRALRTLGRPWQVVAVYRDDARSGKYFRRRPGYQRMLEDIRTGAVKADLILVDTTERIGRAEQIREVRRKLRNRYGVEILAAESRFSDPTTPEGKAFSTFEEMRAEGENRVKAHQVVRGKRDLAEQGFWPGGPTPFGLRLVPTLGGPPGRETLLGSKLGPLPEEDWIVAQAYGRVYSLGEGQSKVAAALTADPEIPDRFKPFRGSTVGYWLDNPIYRGELVWNEHATGVVDDVRRIEPNPEDEVLRVPGFCPAIVDDEVWHAVRRVRDARRARHARGGRDGNRCEEKAIAPLAPGMTLKYPLTGLVRCGRCRGAMQPTSGGGKDGKRYVYYACPGRSDGACDNRRHVPEPWLRDVVVSHLVGTLFPTGAEAGRVVAPTAEGVAAAGWFRRFRDEVIAHLERGRVPDGPSGFEAEDAGLARQLGGWMQSLGCPDLGPAVRVEIQRRYDAALARRQEIAALIAAREAARRNRDAAVDAAAVAAGLGRLSRALANDNATLTNLELSLHIDRIVCHPDGRVVLRLCRLGGLAGTVVLLSDPAAESTVDAGRDGNGDADGEGIAMINPRRRARLRVDGGSDEEDEGLIATAEWAADPDRFAGLGPQWFEEREFRVPTNVPWYEEHAEAVLARVEEIERGGGTASLNKLAPEFGVSRPTLTRALKAARARRAAAAAR